MGTIEDFMAQWRMDCPYIEAYTSGSTGEPKAIKLLKSDMIASARATNKRFDINRNSVLAAPLSTDYIAGKMMCVRALEASCRLLQLEVSNAFELDTHVDLLAIVPSQVDKLVEIENVSNKVGNVLVGGACLQPERASALLRADLKAFVSYGMTETCSHVALAPVTESEYIYKAMPDISFDIDSRSCLKISAPNFSFKELVTNDVVDLIDSTSFVWRGRYDNVINSGGIKLSAEELEREISRIFPGREFYIASAPDKKWGEIVVMVFEGNDEEIESVKEIIRSSMDHKRVPKRFIAVSQLPRTANGKVRRIVTNLC